MATGPRIVALLVLVAFLPACASSRVGSARTLDDAPSASPEVCATGDGDALRAACLVARAPAARDGLELAELKTLLPAD